MPTTRDGEGRLCLGGVPLETALSEAGFGTPAYVYDLSGMAADAKELDSAFEGAPHLVAYALKANTAGPVVRALAAEGCGADVVSGAELAVALACGIRPDDVVFSGVAKRDAELDAAIGAGPAGIGAVQIESVEEIERVVRRARALGRPARVSLRLNPAVDKDALDTHHHIATGHDEAKFGIPKDDVGAAMDAVRAAGPSIALVGLSVHVGSQFTTTAAYLEAARVLFDIARSLPERSTLRFLDTGGGFGIDYGEGCPARPKDFVRETRLAQRAAGLEGLALHVEPGRSLVAAHGVLVASVIQAKLARERRWLLVDAGMNDLMRPALYQARHRVVPLTLASEGNTTWRVVGPVCESSDDFGLHELPRTPPRAVALLDAGAYGFTMASEYNGRPLPAEIFLRKGRVVAKSPAADVGRFVHSRVAIDEQG